MSSISPENRAKRGALLAVITGGLTLLIFAVMTIYAGSNPKPFTHPNAGGFNSAMIWLELAADRAEVAQILGPVTDERGRAIRRALDRANYVDFAFMIAYSAFTACLFILVHILCVNQGRGLLASARVLNFGLGLSLLIYLGDLGETIQLLILTGPDHGVGTDTVLYLNIATRVKWGAIFLACLLLGAGYAAYFRFSPGLVIALAFSICGVVGLMGISVMSARALTEPASLVLGVAWILAFAHGLGLLVRKPKAQ